MRSSAAARWARPSWSVCTSSRARKYSSAMLSAASTATFSVSPAGDSRRPAASSRRRRRPARRRRPDRAAPDRIPLAVDVDGHDAGGIGHVCLEIQTFDLREHVVDARANQLALLAQGGDLGAVLRLPRGAPSSRRARASAARSRPTRGCVARSRSTMPTSSLTFSSSRSMGSKIDPRHHRLRHVVLLMISAPLHRRRGSASTIRSVAAERIVPRTARQARCRRRGSRRGVGRCTGRSSDGTALALRAEQLAKEGEQRALQIRERDVLADDQPFDLREHRRVREVELSRR